MNGQNKGKIMNNKIPSEEEIEKLLRKVQPLPRPTFHKRMTNQPWSSEPRLPFWSLRKTKNAAISLVIIFAFGIGITLLSPSLNTMAQRFTLFFLPSPSNIDFGAITVLETSHPQERFDFDREPVETAGQILALGQPQPGQAQQDRHDQIVADHRR